MLKQRKILVTDGQDQLRWGHNKEGIFNIKEAKINYPKPISMCFSEVLAKTLEPPRMDEYQDFYVVSSSQENINLG